MVIACHCSTEKTYILIYLYVTYVILCLQVKMPSLADVVKQANETFVATLQDILKGVPLPPGVKMPELKLPPLPNVSDATNDATSYKFLRCC
jgi:hypothetical protein